MSSSSNKGSRVKVKKKRDIRPNPTNSNESSSPPPSSMSSSAAVVKRVVRRRSKHHAGDADTSDDDDSDSNNSTDDDVTNNNNNDDTSNTNATVAECESVAAPLAVAALSLSAGSVLRKSPFRSEAIVGAMSASTGSVGATRSRSGSRSSPRDSFNRPTNISAKNLLGVEHAGFLRVFNGPPGQRMRFDDKTKSQFLMLRAADLYVYRSRDDDTPSEVIPLRASAVKVISGGDGMFAVPGTSADSPRSVSSAADEPSTPLSSSATLPSAPAPATAQLQRRDSPPRDNGNAPSILSSLKNRRLRRGSLSGLPQSHALSSLSHSPSRALDEQHDSDAGDAADGSLTPTSGGAPLPTVGGGSCVFALFAPAASKTFLARDAEDMNEWVAKLNQAATRLLSEVLEEVGVALPNAVEPDVTRSVRAAGGAVVSERELARRVAALRALPGNDRCCDCGAADTAWVLANKGGLICIDCSGVHRQMGVTVSKVRSFELDQWSEAALGFLERTGNVVLNERLEHRRANADRDRTQLTRTDFLRKKYVDRAYVSSRNRTEDGEEFVETFA